MYRSEGHPHNPLDIYHLRSRNGFKSELTVHMSNMDPEEVYLGVSASADVGIRWVCIDPDSLDELIVVLMYAKSQIEKSTPLT